MAVQFPLRWDYAAILAALWVGIALHTGLSMRRYGRRWWVWFAICVFATVIPATVVSYLAYRRELRRQREKGAAAYLQCPHCGSVLAGRERRRVGGKSVCPNCDMVLGEEHYA